jgi:hypothetical protein
MLKKNFMTQLKKSFSNLLLSIPQPRHDKKHAPSLNPANCGQHGVSSRKNANNKTSTNNYSAMPAFCALPLPFLLLPLPALLPSFLL